MKLQKALILLQPNPLERVPSHLGDNQSRRKRLAAAQAHLAPGRAPCTRVSAALQEPGRCAGQLRAGHLGPPAQQ